MASIYHQMLPTVPGGGGGGGGGGSGNNTPRNSINYLNVPLGSVGGASDGSGGGLYFSLPATPNPNSLVTPNAFAAAAAAAAMANAAAAGMVSSNNELLLPPTPGGGGGGGGGGAATQMHATPNSYMRKLQHTTAAAAVAASSVAAVAPQHTNSNQNTNIQASTASAFSVDGGGFDFPFPLGEFSLDLNQSNGGGGGGSNSGPAGADAALSSGVGGVSGPFTPSGVDLSQQQPSMGSSSHDPAFSPPAHYGVAVKQQQQQQQQQQQLQQQNGGGHHPVTPFGGMNGKPPQQIAPANSNGQNYNAMIQAALTTATAKALEMVQRTGTANTNTSTSSASNSAMNTGTTHATNPNPSTAVATTSTVATTVSRSNPNTFGNLLPLPALPPLPPIGAFAVKPLPPGTVGSGHRNGSSSNLSQFDADDVVVDDAASIVVGHNTISSSGDEFGPHGVKRKAPPQSSSNSMAVAAAAVAAAAAAAAAAARNKPVDRTAVACLPCSRSKVKCDHERPCGRCVKRGMTDQCVDRVHRPMGRPPKKQKDVDMYGNPIYHSSPYTGLPTGFAGPILPPNHPLYAQQQQQQQQQRAAAQHHQHQHNPYGQPNPFLHPQSMAMGGGYHHQRRSPTHPDSPPSPTNLSVGGLFGTPQHPFSSTAGFANTANSGGGANTNPYFRNSGAGAAGGQSPLAAGYLPDETNAFGGYPGGGGSGGGDGSDEDDVNNANGMALLLEKDAERVYESGFVRQNTTDLMARLQRKRQQTMGTANTTVSNWVDRSLHGVTEDMSKLFVSEVTKYKCSMLYSSSQVFAFHLNLYDTAMQHMLSREHYERVHAHIMMNAPPQIAKNLHQLPAYKFQWIQQLNADRDPTWELPIAMIRHTPFSFANRNFQSAVFMNQAAQQLTGYTTQEYIDLFRGQPVTFKLYHPNDWGKLMGFEMIALDTTVPATMQAHEDKERADAQSSLNEHVAKVATAIVPAGAPGTITPGIGGTNPALPTTLPIVWSGEKGAVLIGDAATAESLKQQHFNRSQQFGVATARAIATTGGAALMSDSSSSSAGAGVGLGSISPTNSVSSTSPLAQRMGATTTGGGGGGGGGVNGMSIGSNSSAGSSSPLSIGSNGPRSPGAPSLSHGSGSTSPFTNVGEVKAPIGGSVNLAGGNSISPLNAGGAGGAGAAASLSSLGGGSLSAAQWRQAQHHAAGATSSTHGMGGSSSAAAVHMGMPSLGGPPPLPAPAAAPAFGAGGNSSNQYAANAAVAAGEHTFPGTKSIIIPGMTATPESVELRALVNIVHKSGRLIPAILQSKITLDVLRLPSIVICLMPVPDS